MASHSNDAPYCLLPSCKKLETFNDQFPRKFPKTNIINTFFKIPAMSLFFTLFTPPSPSCKNLEKTNEGYSKTDEHTDGQTDEQGRLLRTPSSKAGSKIRKVTLNQMIFDLHLQV